MTTSTLASIDAARLPAYLLFARLGKKVLRPGGLSFTKDLLSIVALKGRHVLEFAPGRGATASLIVAQKPATYTGIEHHADFAHQLQFDNPAYRVATGSMTRTGLADGHYDVVVGEAFLSLQADVSKQHVLEEAYRLLKPGGIYILHELSVASKETEQSYQELLREMRDTLKVGATPLPVVHWKQLAQGVGFTVKRSFQRPMALLSPGRVIEDEGIANVFRILWNVITTPGALTRLRSIRALFQRHAHRISAIGLILQKP